MKRMYCLIGILFFLLHTHGQTTNNSSDISIKGKVIDATSREPLSGVAISVHKENITLLSDGNGDFFFSVKSLPDTVTASFIGYGSKTITVRDDKPVVILLNPISGLLDSVVVSTGYQRIPKERATGSFGFIDEQLLNRSVGTNILNRIENITPGVFFDHSPLSGESILIRGRNTIFNSTAPLVVVNDFPYDGDISNLNPNDIESITILRDAAAASIWGAKAGNGVIVITTKKGKTAKPQVELYTSTTFIQKPDLFNVPLINSADYIDLEKDLFAKGYYATDELFNQLGFGYPPYTPVVELLLAKRDSMINAAEADARIEVFRQYDARNDIQKYFYRTAINQQHALNISGTGNNVNYFLSAGWDKNSSDLVGSDYNRVTLRTQNTFTITRRLQADAGIYFAESRNRSGNNPGYMLTNGSVKALYPYAQLADAKGEPLAIVRDYSRDFIKNAEQKGFLNWQYYPLKDLGETKNLSVAKDYVANTGLRYELFPSLTIDLKYRYENQVIERDNHYSDSSYFTRNIINQYTQVDPVTGALGYPVPFGGITDASSTEITTHQGRIQLGYNRLFGSKQRVAAIAGWEVKNTKSNSISHRLYGYEEDGSISVPNMDFLTNFQRYDNAFLQAPINNPQAISATLYRFLSYYANASYDYQDRYIVSASARQDGSNLFGVKTNQKFVPLWSAGAAWNVNKEPFYRWSWLPQLKLRLTYGLQGNVSSNASALPTAKYLVSVNTGARTAIMQNPPNERLRWEKISKLNAGIDFAFANNIVNGTIEYYRKTGHDLMGYSVIDPTTGAINLGGVAEYFGNVAGMRGSGVDVLLSSTPVNTQFKWNTTFIFSFASDKITQYDMPVSAIGFNYTNEHFINPVIGRPVYALYSFPWAGLDGETGDPQAYFEGKKSTDYASIIAGTSLDSMVYSGPAKPVVFGSLLNTISFKGFSLSFNISYKFGYYFRRPSVNYSTLFSTWSGNSDYNKRWQKPGDEKFTDVPSMPYPADESRDEFYSYSTALIGRADNIRLEDINLGYDFVRNKQKKFPFKQLRLYVYASNLALLWTANKEHIDPYYLNIPSDRKRIAIGADITF